MDHRFRVGSSFMPKPISAGHPSAKGKESSAKAAFAFVLKEELEKKTLQFSHHADQRLRSRGIEVTDAMLSRLEEAVDKAGQKGARDALILLDNLAFIVSVKNRTVITAMDEESLKENVFTNIDSAVIMQSRTENGGSGLLTD